MRALGFTGLALDDEVIHHVTGIEKGKEACEELNKLCGTQAKHSKVHLLMQLYQLNLGNCLDLTSHINKYNNIKQQFATIGKELDVMKLRLAY